MQLTLQRDRKIVDNIIQTEHVKMDAHLLQARADMDSRLQQEHKDMQHKAMVEQVRMEGKLMEDRVMLLSHVQCQSIPPQRHVFNSPPVSTLHRCYSFTTEILCEHFLSLGNLMWVIHV